jgi:hypothetical protein
MILYILLSELIIRVFLALAAMAKWHIEVVCVKGAFLKGEFADSEIIHMELH